MSHVELDGSDFRRRMMGCWLGKAVGGTLGMPYEGVRKTLDLHYYDPVPTEMLPNDDLDAQVVYAYMLSRMLEPRVDREVLTESWRHVGMSTDEYGIVKRNLRLGLRAPSTGSYDNPFTLGMGAAIRTEIWACLAPGDPDLAAAYAYEDACMDHADEGIHAAVFLAALQSMAFVQQDRDTLIKHAMEYIPRESKLRNALSDTMSWWVESGDWRFVQRRQAERYLNDNFTDVVINLSYIMLGWLAGRDFGEAICIAVNCGQDTDCTGATLGALLGILDPDAIDDRWLEPIGRQLVLSPSVTGVTHPPTLDGFTDLMLDLHRRVGGHRPSVVSAHQPTLHLAIRADVGQLSGELSAVRGRPSLPPDSESVLMQGTWARMETSAFSKELVVVRYRLSPETSAWNHIMFCTRDPVRVWWDGRLIIDSPGGEFVPAFHRCVPEGNVKRVHVTAGDHELLAVMKRPATGQLEWVVGISTDPTAPGCRDWIDDPFERPKWNRKRSSAGIVHAGQVAQP